MDKDQKRSGDGLNFMRWLYKPGLFRRALWPIVKIDAEKEGSFRRQGYLDALQESLKRDSWERSEAEKSS